MKTLTTLTIVLILTTCYSFSSSIATSNSGNWSNKSTWATSSLPQDGNEVNVNSPHSLTVASNTYQSKKPKLKIRIDGSVQFLDSKIWLAAGSEIFINSGGSILTSGDNNNDEKIFIGNKVVWDQKMGDFYGPILITENGIGALPVDFVDVSFNSAEWTLNWTTANEENLAHFEIQVSVDGQVFEAYEEVQTDLDNQYESSVDAGYYYRIVGVDIDDSKTISEVVYAKKGLELSFNKISERLYEASEQIFEGGVFTLSGTPQAVEINGRYVDVNSLNEGTYLLKINIGGEWYSEKIHVD